MDLDANTPKGPGAELEIQESVPDFVALTHGWSRPAGTIIRGDGQVRFVHDAAGLANLRFTVPIVQKASA
jgi:hypothetical protein